MITYWLNRRVERAIEGYLKTILTGDMRVYRSADMTPRQFPCAVVRAYGCRRFGGEVYAAQEMAASVIVMTEYARVVNNQAQVLKEFEEIEEAAVSSVMEALYIEDLATQLEAVGIEGVTISYAAIGADEAKPMIAQIEEDGTVSKVEIPLLIHAGAKEL